MNSKFIKPTYVALLFLYMLSLGFVAFLSYSIINTIYHITVFESFHKEDIYKVDIGYTSTRSGPETYLYFLKNDSRIIVKCLDTSAFPESYLEADYFDTTHTKPIFFKNVPIYYSSESDKAYYLNNPALWSKENLFKEISWKIYAISILILLTYGCIFMLKKNNFRMADYRVILIYTTTILTLFVLEFLNWLAGGSFLLGILIFIVVVASLLLASRSNRLKKEQD